MRNDGRPPELVGDAALRHRHRSRERAGRLLGAPNVGIAENAEKQHGPLELVTPAEKVEIDLRKLLERLAQAAGEQELRDLRGRRLPSVERSRQAR